MVRRSSCEARSFVRKRGYRARAAWTCSFAPKVAMLPVLGTTVEMVSLELPPLEDAVAVNPDALYGDNRVYLVEDGQLRSVVGDAGSGIFWMRRTASCC